MSARSELRDRAEQSAELLVGLLGDEIDERLLDGATRLLHEMPQRSPMLDEAKLLADAVNLDDFGASGLVQQMGQLTRQGEGLKQLIEGCAAREKYGYWDARLKDGSSAIPEEVSSVFAAVAASAHLVSPVTRCPTLPRGARSRSR